MNRFLYMKQQAIYRPESRSRIVKILQIFKNHIYSLLLIVGIFFLNFGFLIHFFYSIADFSTFVFVQSILSTKIMAVALSVWSKIAAL
ncbi:hypothetical protein DERF_009340 [Dermatophagoides farinae]|uniref:Uncharacterized protein n=1 Tax=Dermatophagoides farinae TaxID=6954 RepID=A0A922HUW5_DERFA|nr:hypothetical protein DERF_009340 [Dermatophagoides farinae]